MRTRVGDPGLRARCLIVVVLASLAAPAMAQQKEPKTSEPLALARFFPKKDLVVYAEFDGLDAHRDAWTKTAAYRVFNETTTGAMLEETLARMIDEALGGDKSTVRGRELTGLGVQLLRSGFALGINRAGGVGLPRSFGVVVRGGAKEPLRSTIVGYLRSGDNPGKTARTVAKPGGRKVEVQSDAPRTALAWWSQGDDLVVSLVSPTGVDAMITAFDGGEASALDDATRAALRQSADEPGFEPVGLAYFDMAALPALPKEALALGLDHMKRIDFRWGFHGTAIENLVTAVIPSPRKGIPALFDQPGFDARHLPPLPGGLDAFAVLSLDGARFYDQIIASLKSLDATITGAGAPLLVFDSLVEEGIGLNLRREILAPLGSRLVYYSVPRRINTPASLLEGVAHSLVYVPRGAVILDVKDRDAAVRSLAKIAETSKPKPQEENPAQVTGATSSAGLAAMQPLKGSDTGYVCPPSQSLFALPAGVQPTLLLGKQNLVFATTLATARKARDVAERPGPGGVPPGDALAPWLERLPDHMIFLSVVDMRESLLPDLLAAAPNMALNDTVAPIALAFLGMNSMPFRVGPSGSEAGKAPKPVPYFDPELIPDPDVIRPLLFPAVAALSVDDRGIRFLSREPFPSINVASALPVAIAALVPLAHQARVGAQRAQTVKKLDAINLAMRNYLEANKHFPADIRGKDGKPLLSWRVAILEQLNEASLLGEFHRDEPWDSPHNKALLKRMPEVFALPNDSSMEAKIGVTPYRGIAGKGTLFDPAFSQGLDPAKITDGMATTIALVEAKESVPWTKPDTEVPFDSAAKPEAIKALIGSLGGHSPGGFHVVFSDGTTKFIAETIDAGVFRSLITRDGGETVERTSF